MLKEKNSVLSPSRFLSGRAMVKPNGPRGEIQDNVTPADAR